jgi:hypothetical protein
MHPAKASRLAKEKNPENWCKDAKCLWNTRRSGPCPKHEQEPPPRSELPGFVQDRKAEWLGGYEL